MQLLICSLSYIYMLLCVLREEREKEREFRSMLDAVCVSVVERKQPYALHPKVYECINTELCVLCARQSSGLQLACSTIAHLNIETQKGVCGCVYEGGQPSCSS